MVAHHGLDGGLTAHPGLYLYVWDLLWQTRGHHESSVSQLRLQTRFQLGSKTRRVWVELGHELSSSWRGVGNSETP